MLLEFFKPTWWTRGAHSEMLEVCMVLTAAEAQPAMAMLRTSWPQSCASVGFSAPSEAHARALGSPKPDREVGQHELYAYFAPTTRVTGVTYPFGCHSDSCALCTPHVTPHGAGTADAQFYTLKCGRSICFDGRYTRHLHLAMLGEGFCVGVRRLG